MVVVGPVQREPGGVKTRSSEGVADLNQGGGLATAGGSAQQRHLDRPCRRNRPAHRQALHLGGGDAGRAELGQQWVAGRRGGYER